MAGEPTLTHTSALILQTISAGYRYGFDIMETTGLASGTVYPALRRLEQLGLVESKWESEREALVHMRPARRNYHLTRSGERALAKAVERYPLLSQMNPESKQS
jgi:PadR family transcriptional regulator PadR